MEYQGRDEVALEVSQCYYYIVCLAVFLGESYVSLELKAKLEEPITSKHELAKRIARTAAEVCHTPCLSTINRLPPLLMKALEMSGSSLEHMYTHL